MALGKPVVNPWSGAAVIGITGGVVFAGGAFGFGLLAGGGDTATGGAAIVVMLVDVPGRDSIGRSAFVRGPSIKAG